jgi:predicted nucleic acid-binding protein
MAERTGKPVARLSAFWDTSALVPLCVRQGTTPQAITLYKSYEVVVWWATSVEIASALARLVRMKQLDPGEWIQARGLAAALADAWSVVQPSDALRAQAALLVNHYDLRAADALQLAAALEWCGNTPQGRVFVTADQTLLQAAILSGFEGSPI